MTLQGYNSAWTTPVQGVEVPSGLPVKLGNVLYVLFDGNGYAASVGGSGVPSVEAIPRFSYAELGGLTSVLSFSSALWFTVETGGATRVYRYDETLAVTTEFTTSDGDGGMLVTNGVELFLVYANASDGLTIRARASGAWSSLATLNTPGTDPHVIRTCAIGTDWVVLYEDTQALGFWYLWSSNVLIAGPSLPPFSVNPLGPTAFNGFIYLLAPALAGPTTGSWLIKINPADGAIVTTNLLSQTQAFSQSGSLMSYGGSLYWGTAASPPKLFKSAGTSTLTWSQVT